MAIYKRDIVDINLETGNIHRSFLKHSIGYLDQAADHFGIRVLRNGEPVDLTGVTVQGIFMPPQGNPIAITTGNIIEGNVAEVVLPQACYNYDGQFCLSIKLVDATNAITGTMRIVDGMVDNTHASGTVAPTGAVPTYQEVLAVYDDMVAALVTVDELDDEVSDLKSALYGITGNNAEPFCVSPVTVSVTLNTSSSVNPADGGNSGTGCRTTYLRYYNPLVVAFDNDDYLISAWIYTTNGVPGAYKGLTGGVYLSGVDRKIYIPNIPNDDSVYFRLGFVKPDGSSMTSTDTDAIIASLSFYELTDKTLTIADVPADAKTTGEKITENRTDIDGIMSRMGRKNWFDPNDSDVVEGQFISGLSSGSEVWTENAGYGESGFIPVQNGDKITFFVAGSSNVSNLYRVFYDASKEPLSSGGTMPDNKYITISNANIKYMRVAFSLANKTKFMVVKLTDQDATPYSPEGEVYVPYPNLTLPYIIKSTDEKISNSLGSQWYGKTWYAYGTSITETDNAAHTGKYVPYLAAMSGMTVTNRGHGGQGIGDFGSTSTGMNYSAICKLTDGKANADLITLEQGANDVGAGVPLGTIYDTGRYTSLAGCLNDCIRYLLENTTAQIVVMNSPYSKTMPSLTSQVFEWREMMRKICLLNGVHFLDTSCGLGTARLTSANGSNYVVDNIHQTELGGYIFAENIWYKLRNIPLFRTSIPNL